MKICGLNKTTLLDYPGCVAATVFAGGCNFRCPFCHNSDLLGNDAEEAFTEEYVLNFLKKRRGILEGVAITGGEPTLQPDLRDFILRVRELGYKIKLDTNGTRPDVLRDLCDSGFIDYVAMDIKTCKERYSDVAGIPSLHMEGILESVEYLKNGKIPFEFRTTVVKELHSAEDFERIGQWISGCPHYYLQNFVDSDNVLVDGFSAYPKEELLDFIEILKPYIPNAELRGVDY